MGSAYHAGIEALNNGLGLEGAVGAVRDAYFAMPENFDLWSWSIECETVVRLICGYEWRWRDCGWKNVAAEQSFDLPLTNPETNKASRTFRRGGKIDGIIDVNGRLCVQECKLLGDDIGPESDLWKRLRIDPQISNYVIAARELGYTVESVMYDVTRKPTIQPTNIPLLDEDGIKIVLDADGNRVKTKDGKKWRQTADAELGYVLKTRLMTVEEWGNKLTEDIVSRPDYYYQRNEIARLDKDLAEFKSETWDVAKTIAEAQNSGRWYRTVSKDTCNYCEFFSLCSSNFQPGVDHLPEQFVTLSDIHPELRSNPNVIASQPTCTTPATAAASADIRTADLDAADLDAAVAELEHESVPYF